MIVNCGIGNWVFLTLWTMAIRSNTVASIEQKMPSKVEFRVLAGRLWWIKKQYGKVRG